MKAVYIFFLLVCFHAALFSTETPSASELDAIKFLEQLAPRYSDRDIREIPDEELEFFFRNNVDAIMYEHFYAHSKLVDFIRLNRPRQKKIAGNSFSNDISDALSTLHEEAPQLFEKLDRMDRAKMLAALFAALDSGIRQPDEDESKNAPEPATASECEYYPPRLIVSNRILYLRMDCFASERIGSSADETRKLEDELKAASRLANQPLGIIIDLRKSDSYDLSAALRMLAFFCNPSEMKEIPVPENSKPLFDLPVAVLISPETKGDAEVFAFLIEKFKQGITIGETTAGMPVKLRKVKILDYDWLVPDIPFSVMEPHAHHPMIAVASSPQIEFGMISESEEFTHRDPCLSRAVDLILSLDALKNRQLLQNKK